VKRLRRRPPCRERETVPLVPDLYGHVIKLERNLQPGEAFERLLFTDIGG
jgi:hypothetical protein